MILIQVKAPHFCAGIVIERGVVAHAPPILKYMMKGKWTLEQVRRYCDSKGWAAKEVKA